MNNFILDQRNASTLIDPAHRERLARVDPMYIQSYVSWAAANSKLRQVADLAEKVAEAVRNKDTSVLLGQASIIAHDNDEFAQLQIEIEGLDDKGRLFLSNRAQQKAESLRRKVLILEEAWNRNIDLEVSGRGESRREVGNVLTSEKGGILPAEYGMNNRGGNGQQPNVVVVNTAEQKKERRGFQGLR